MSITFKSTKENLSKTKNKWDNNQNPFLKKIWNKRLQSKVESVDSYEKRVMGCGYNSLYGAIISSFNEHVPLLLTPDAIWLQILQQLAIHIGENSKALRNKFVDFEDKKVIKVKRDDFVKGQMNPWGEVFPEFTNQIREYIGDKNYNAMISKFTTTTEITQAAQEVALMDCMQSYFDYMFVTKCGIPEITLDGTRDDWELILSKVDGLVDYDLGWWIKELKVLLKEFVNVWDDNIDLDFWNSFVNEYGFSGGPYFYGHMLRLSAYTTGYNKKIYRMDGWDSDGGRKNMITVNSFTSGISSVPFLWEYYSTIYPMTFVSGFVGIDKIDGAYCPNISWAVSDRKMGEEELDEEVDRFSKELSNQGMQEDSNQLTKAYIDKRKIRRLND